MRPPPSPPLNKVVSRRLRELRQAADLDQVELAAEAEEHIKRATVSDIETGRRMPSIETLEALGRALKVHPAALLLNPQEDRRHRAALAVLTCPARVLEALEKLLDLD